MPVSFLTAAQHESYGHFAGTPTADELGVLHIYYNACILSELLERAERRQDYQRADAIKRANPASWKHVNLYGAYSFLDIGDGVDLQELVNLLEAARGRGTAVPD